jgi:chemotaxis protein CheC
MGFNNIEELDTMHLDVLRELGNIGSGNAATSLATLMGKEININVPHVKILGFDEVADYVGGPEKVVMGLLITLEEDINGMILYILDDDFAKNVVKAFFGTEFTSLTDLGEMEKSAFNEIGNIMAGAYVNALSSMTGMTINISTPSICVDMAGAILNVPSVKFAEVGDKVLFIDDSFGVGDYKQEVKSNMILVPEMESLNNLFTRLGVM